MGPGAKGPWGPNSCSFSGTRRVLFGKWPNGKRRRPEAYASLAKGAQPGVRKLHFAGEKLAEEIFAKFSNILMANEGRRLRPASTTPLLTPIYHSLPSPISPICHSPSTISPISHLPSLTLYPLRDFTVVLSSKTIKCHKPILFYFLFYFYAKQGHNLVCVHEMRPNKFSKFNALMLSR